MSQNIGAQILGIGGNKNACNLTAASLIKSTPGTLFGIAVIVAGTGGAFTFNDSNCLVTAQTITGITQAVNGVVTLSTGGSTNPFAVGNTITFASIAGMTQLNGLVGTVTAIGGVTTAWTVTISINTTAFTAWSSGGTAASFGAGNEIYTLPEASAAITLAGAFYELAFPCVNGILLSAVQSGGGVLAAAYS